MIILALLTHCGLDVVIHAISLGVFLWFSLFLLNMFLNGVCEEFGDILVLYILTLS
jgi:hypothetical protein